MSVVGADTIDNRRYFLPVGADILHGSSADRAGNTGEAFHASTIQSKALLHEVVPGDTCADAELRSVFFFEEIKAWDADFEDEAVESIVGDEQVAASAENEEIDSALDRPGDGFFDFSFSSGLDKPARKAANTKRGQRSERLVFNEMHWIKSIATGLDWLGSEYRRTNLRGLKRGLTIEWIGVMPLPEVFMYPEIMLIPMREELTRAGIKEARTAEDVDAALAKNGTTMVVVNSVCGCAAGKMRPGVRLALANSANQPDRQISVFAGQDGEATERARSYFEGNPPTSPAVAILRDGKLVYLMQRYIIEQATAQQIAGELVRAFDELCVKTVANGQ